jgi:hypothetical protein
MLEPFKKLTKKTKLLQSLITVFLTALIAAIGYHLIGSSRAQTPYINGYAANGTVTGNASLISGGSSTGGQAVQFGTASSSSMFPLKVAGNLLETATGNRFVVKGVAQTLYNQSADQMISAEYAQDYSYWHAFMVSQGVNLLRLSTNADDYIDSTYVPQSTYMTDITNIEQNASKDGLAFEICNMDSTYDGTSLPTDYTNWHPYWLALKTLINSNPNIIIEPFNEPNGLSETQWLSTMEGELAFWRGTGADQMDYKGVIVVDTDEWSHDFYASDNQTLVNYSDTLATPNNLIFSIHQYATDYSDSASGFTATDQQSFQNNYTQYDTTFPMFVDEYGNDNGSDINTSSTPNSSYYNYLSQISQFFASKVPGGFNGASAWQFAWGDWNQMTDDTYQDSQPPQTSYDPTNPQWDNFWGIIYEDYYVDNVSSYL